MFNHENNDELINKIEQLLSGQITLENAKADTNREERELLDLVNRLNNHQSTFNPSFKSSLQRKLMKHYQRPRFALRTLWPGFTRLRIITASSLAALLLLSGIAMAIPGMRKLIINPPSGNIEVISAPEKAKVFLNTSFKGTTPLRLKDIAAGSYELKVSKDNYEDWSGLLKVKPDNTLRIVVELNSIELVVVKPKSTPKADNSRLEETPIISPPAIDKETGETAKQNNVTDTSGESESNPETDSTISQTESGSQQSELLPSSESLIIASDKTIYRMTSEGKKEKILDDAAITEATLSTSGNMLALAYKDTLKVLNLNTKITIFTYKASSWVKNLRWSPNEDSLLFTALEEDSLKSALFLVNIPSGVVKKLVLGKTGSWSSDGLYIAYTKDAGGIFIANIEGNKEQQIMSQIKVMDLKWNPGVKIAFTAIPLTGPSNNPHLYIIDRDGTEFKKIATNCVEFSWSPNGRSIVFEKTEKQQSNIYLVNFEDSDNVIIAKSAASPRFSPDSNRIAFLKEDGLNIAQSDGANANRILQESDITLVGWTASGDN